MDNPLTSTPSRFSLTALKRMRLLIQTKSTLLEKVGMCFMRCSLSPVVTTGFPLQLSCNRMGRTNCKSWSSAQGMSAQLLKVSWERLHSISPVRDRVLCTLVPKRTKGTCVPSHRSKPGGSAGLLPEPAGVRVWDFLIDLLLLGPLSTSFCFPCTLLVPKIITHSSHEVF